ncbi:MAG: hypothetical protein RIC89_09880, partial [Pseudomonadales bacterium]
MTKKCLDETILELLEVNDRAVEQIRHRMIVRGDPEALGEFRSFIRFKNWDWWEDSETAKQIINSQFIDTAGVIGFQWTSPNIDEFLLELAKHWPDVAFLIERAHFGNDGSLSRLSVTMSYRGDDGVHDLVVSETTSTEELDQFWDEARSRLTIKMIK